jgi:hypothetical protein
VNDWLQDYREFWGESLRNLKRYIEETENQKNKRS